MEESLRCDAPACVGAVPIDAPVALLLLVEARLRGVLEPEVDGALVAAAEPLWEIMVETPDAEPLREALPVAFPLEVGAPGGPVVLDVAPGAAETGCELAGEPAVPRTGKIVAGPCGLLETATAPVVGTLTMLAPDCSGGDGSWPERAMLKALALARWMPSVPIPLQRSKSLAWMPVVQA